MPEIRVNIAAITFALRCDDKDFFSRFIRLHRLFLTDRKADFVLDFLKSRGRQDLFSVAIAQNKGRIAIVFKNRKRLRESFGLGYLKVAKNNVDLENYLRIFLSQYLFGAGGFLLHASSICYKGKAYLFTGPSGSGKSTIARLCRGKLILTDDLTVIRKIGVTYYAFGAPFGLQSKESAGLSFPVSRVYFIGHAAETNFKKVSLDVALPKVISNIVLMGGTDLITSGQILETCYNFFKDVDCYELNFAKKRSLWKDLRIDE